MLEHLVSFNGRDDWWKLPTDGFVPRIPELSWNNFNGHPDLALELPLTPFQVEKAVVPFSTWRVRGYACDRDMKLLDGNDMTSAVKVIAALDLNETDYEDFSLALKNWDFSALLDVVYEKLLSLPNKQQTEAMRLIDAYGPPQTFVSALEALTVEQKAHLDLLARDKRMRELSQVLRGVILSLPDEDQLQARKFVASVKYLFGKL
ncbi:hypothetical protein AAVH_19930 [Aphelenchoides avenae]|nr:hypothetical protein AAVH_19930 [Aphelenchus avenae]